MELVSLIIEQATLSARGIVFVELDWVLRGFGMYMSGGKNKWVIV